MKSCRIEKNIWQWVVELKLFGRKLEFWNFFEDWSFKNYLKIEVLKIKFKNWKFGN